MTTKGNLTPTASPTKMAQAPTAAALIFPQYPQCPCGQGLNCQTAHGIATGPAIWETN
jgi:hypothetical protein